MTSAAKGNTMIDPSPTTMIDPTVVSMARPLSRRRLLAGVAATAVAGAGLSGCAQVGVDYRQPRGAVPAQYRDRTRVVFWSAFGGDIIAVINALVDRFNAAQTDIFVEIQGFANYDTVDQKLAAGLQARQIPDLVVLSDISWNRYFLNDTLEPLDGYFDAGFTPDAYDDLLLDEGRVDGSIWWTPLARSTPLMYLNPEILSAAGLPRRAPETWEEFRAWGKELAGVTYLGNTPRMRAYTGGDDWYFAGQLWSFGGGVSRGLDVTLDSPESLAAARFDHDIIHTDKTGYLAASHTNDFLAGNVACIQSSTGSLTSLTKNAKFDLVTGFLPKGPDIGVPSGGSGMAIMKYASAERKQAAFEFVKFMAQEQQSAEWSAQTGYMPCTKAAAASTMITELVKSNPNYGVAVKQLEIARRPDDVRRYVSTCILKHKSALQQIYAGDIDPDQVMTATATDLRRSVERVLTQYPTKLKR